MSDILNNVCSVCGDESPYGRVCFNCRKGKKEHVYCDRCGKEFEIGVVELSRSRPPVLCKDCR